MTANGFKKLEIQKQINNYNYICDLIETAILNSGYYDNVLGIIPVAEIVLIHLNRGNPIHELDIESDYWE